MKLKNIAQCNFSQILKLKEKSKCNSKTNCSITHVIELENNTPPPSAKQHFSYLKKICFDVKNKYFLTILKSSTVYYVCVKNNKNRSNSILIFNKFQVNIKVSFLWMSMRFFFYKFIKVSSFVNGYVVFILQFFLSLFLCEWVCGIYFRIFF